MFYHIIMKNFKSNLKNYILFFVSNILAIAELFAFWGLNDVVKKAVKDGVTAATLKSDFVLAAGLITFITVFLMIFSMKYYMKLAFVFQDYYLMDSLSIKENIMLPLILDEADIQESKKKCEEMAEKFAITDLLDKKPYELSGGEKQRTAICRALIYNPDLILADEPTGNLDSASSEVVIHTLEEINKKMGKTILLVTHDPIIASSCDRIIFLKDGKVKEDLKRTGDKEQFYNEIITNWC